VVLEGADEATGNIISRCRTNWKRQLGRKSHGAFGTGSSYDTSPLGGLTHASAALADVNACLFRELLLFFAVPC
jgi:hypothetical protein